MCEMLKDTMKPDWEEIHRARENCARYLADCKFSSEVINAITMVVHELLENALKYGNYEKNDVCITYSLQVSKNKIITEVINPISGEDTPHFKMLDKTIQWIRGYQNPFEAYIEKLKEVSERPLKNKESGLGLVRVAYEGMSILDFYLRSDNYICVSAVYQL
jgi:hypothetical protein